jgi:hypothetical protein
VVRDVIAAGNMTRVGELLGGGYIILGEANEGVVRITDSHKLLPPSGDYTVTVNEKAATITIDSRSIRLSEPISGGVVIRF